jgi:hypothetical protein
LDLASGIPDRWLLEYIVSAKLASNGGYTTLGTTQMASFFALGHIRHCVDLFRAADGASGHVIAWINWASLARRARSDFSQRELL